MFLPFGAPPSFEILSPTDVLANALSDDLSSDIQGVSKKCIPFRYRLDTHDCTHQKWKMHIRFKDTGLLVHLKQTGFKNLQYYGSCEFFKQRGQKSTCPIGTFIMEKRAKMNDLKKSQFFTFEFLQKTCTIRKSRQNQEKLIEWFCNKLSWIFFINFLKLHPQN